MFFWLCSISKMVGILDLPHEILSIIFKYSEAYQGNTYEHNGNHGIIGFNMTIEFLFLTRVCSKFRKHLGRPAWYVNNFFGSFKHKAITAGQLNILKYLLSLVPLISKEDALVALNYGHFHIFKWLLPNFISNISAFAYEIMQKDDSLLLHVIKNYNLPKKELENLLYYSRDCINKFKILLSAKETNMVDSLCSVMHLSSFKDFCKICLENATPQQEIAIYNAILERGYEEKLVELAIDGVNIDHHFILSKEKSFAKWYFTRGPGSPSAQKN